MIFAQKRPVRKKLPNGLYLAGLLRAGMKFLVFFFKMGRAAFLAVRAQLDGGGVLRRGHAGDFFKVARKVVNGRVTKIVGDFGKILCAFADGLLGAVHHHISEIFHHAAAGLFAEDLL